MAVTILKMSQLSMTMVEGVVVKWYKQEGDMVQADEPLLDVETDKVVKEMTAPASGKLIKICAEEMDIVPVGQDLCHISDEQGTEDAPPAPDISIAAAAPAPLSPPASAPAHSTAAKIKISPLAKRIASLKGVDYAALTGTGPGGLIVKKDIENANVPASPVTAIPTTIINAPAPQDQIIPFTGIRRRIADNMMKSVHNSATVSAIAEVNMGKVADYRKYLPVSYTAYTITAVSRALSEPKFAIMNSRMVDDTIVIKGEVNISVSVATDNGLVTPVIQHANEKNLLSIGDELVQLAARAREGKLELADMSGGTFTITNSGIYGSLLYTPIINYPQAAIIGMGKILKTPVVINDEITIAPMMYLCISYDHRLIDGDVGAPFLQRVKYYLEHPEELVAPRKENEP